MTSDRVNRRELIIDTAAQLFREHGYNATSVRQIADAVGVTEAALYYHFKAGKRELLESVLACQLPDFSENIVQCVNSESLADFIRCFTAHGIAKGRTDMDQFRWIISEFPNLSDEERAAFHNHHLDFHQTLIHAFEKFIADPEKARRTALMFVCLMLGYGQLYWNLEMEKVEEYTPDMAVETIIHYLEAGIK